MSKDDKPDQREILNPVLSRDGSMRAMNYILDLARKRKHCVTFIFDEETGHIREVANRHTKVIEVRYTSSRT